MNPIQTEAKGIFTIVGVESTGKSNAAEFLAQQIDATHIPEYARLYLDQHNNQYNHAGFLDIAQGQLELENHAFENANKNDILVFDTNFVVIYVWSLYVYKDVPQWIKDRIRSYPDIIYFLMTPEVPWVNDGMREYPDLSTREKIHNIYIQVLQQFDLKYHIIDGDSYSERQDKMLQFTKSYLPVKVIENNA
ncbi:MAG: ATP-binding protein [Saprospiraceae bacterium]|nr:ATP-binding protein [Saprospiraceae bacterium]